MTYIIAEVGQNHNGDMKQALKLIKVAKEAGCDAVKFTMRNLDYEFTKEFGDKLYDSPHSYGKTYREHREALEINGANMSVVVGMCRQYKIDFILTPCHPSIIDNFLGINDRAAAIKIASRDITNYPLIDAIIKKTSLPIIISTGLSENMLEIQRALWRIHARVAKNKFRRKVTVMHCVSEYPLVQEDVRLMRMEALRRRFMRLCNEVGYSDHIIGYKACVLAVAMGAKVIEKHITLNRKGKGSDHAGSLEPDELLIMVNEIRRAELIIGYEGELIFYESPEITRNRKKLMRSLSSAVPIKEGTEIKQKQLCMLSPGEGFSWDFKNQITGKKATRDISSHTQIERGMWK